MKRVGLIVAAAAIFTTGALAESHLEPEVTALGDGVPSESYDDILATAFKDAFARDVRARVVVEPSFHPEYVVGVKEVGGAYQLFYLEPTIHLWGYPYLDILRSGKVQVLTDHGSAQDEETIRRLESTLPDNPLDVPLKRCEVPVERALGAKIIQVWRAMLARTRFFSPPALGPNGEETGPFKITGDGTTYHFSMRITSEFLAGQTWSPDANGEAGMLVAISDTMRDLCRTKRGSLAVRLNTQVDHLLSRLGAADAAQ